MKIIIPILILFFLISFIAIKSGIANLLIKKRGEMFKKISWKDLGPTPLGEKRYTPQGLTYANGNLIFANTWKNTRSRVYEIDPKNMEIKRYFDMPPEAVHTSGLAWDGEYLWAVDYISNRGYCIDLEPSLSVGKVNIIGSFDTTLKGTSACCIVPWNGQNYLAISDFRRTRKTIFVRKEDAIKAKTAEGAIDFYYLNEYFSQGLEFAKGHLFESENKIGQNVINKIDLKKLEETQDSRKATIMQYSAPSNGVEDLAWDGEYFWTSDESVFRFFKTKQIN